MQVSYGLKWRYGSDPRYQWFLRGIRADGTFYGEITCFLSRGGRQVNVKGQLSEGDLARFLKMVEQIRDAGYIPSPGPWTGLLAEGPVGAPRIIYHYRATEEAAAGCFMALVEILKPYMEKFYAAVEPP
jgi:hypothetical protein